MGNIRHHRSWITSALPAAALWVLTGRGIPAATDEAALAAGKALSELKADASPAEVYEIFNRFCRTHFGAEKEPLVYELFGSDLAIVDGGDWVHPSETSACVAWESTLPALGRVAYGETRDCESRTGEEERFFYNHIHYLKGLKPDTDYYYKVLSTDERGNEVATPVRSLRTRAIPNAVRIPGDLAGPPYILDGTGMTYVLTEDITVPAKAIEVAAGGITLDLDGHTVVYHNETVPPETFDDKWMSYVNKGAYGVRGAGCSGLKLLNGTIREGAGVNSGNSDSEGFMPVYLRELSKVVIAGITVDYHTPQNTGMRLRKAGGDVDVHHCVFLDRGCRINNRHGPAVRALSLMSREGTDYRVHHNLVKRTRQMSLLGADQLNHNESYTDSWSVNSFSMAVWKECGVAHDNRIFGTGVNVQGFGWGEHDTVISSNLVHLQGIDTGTNRGKEGWGDQDSMNGLRVTNYGKGGQARNNLCYDRNVVIINCRGKSQARGTEFFSDETITGLRLRDSTIKVESDDSATDRVACVVTHGQPSKADTCLPVYYEDCRLISNICNVRFGDYYGKGSNHHFIRCVLERTGNADSYHTFVVDGTYWSKRHVLLDCTFGPGTAWDDVLWKLTSNKSFYSIAWTLTLHTAPNAVVRITDAAGEVAFEGTAGATGTLQVPLTQCIVRPPAKLKCPSTEKEIEANTPHTVTVTLGTGEKEALVEMTSRRELVLR